MVVGLRAEDDSGSFGILAGHADLITVLTMSVVSWRQEDGGQGWWACWTRWPFLPGTARCISNIIAAFLLRRRITSGICATPRSRC